MSGVFQEVKLEWNGREFSIPPDSMMRLIAQIEDDLTVADLDNATVNGRPPIAKLSQAYGRMLRFAGCRVTDEEIYKEMFQKGKTQERVMRAIQTLLTIMIPPGSLQEDVPTGKSGAAEAGGGSSQRRTKRQ